MKKLLSIAAFTFLSLISYSQTHSEKTKVDAAGNYVAVAVTKDSSSSKPTGKTYTDTKGNTFPVMISKNGKLYVLVTAKTSGNIYKKYL